MQMFYTAQELKKLSSKELLELTTFGNDENVYYFSDLDKVVKEGNEYSFHFKDGSTAYTQKESTFEKVKVGKARYDMITKSIEQNEEQDQREKQFYANIEKMVSAQIAYGKAAVDEERKAVSELVINLNESNVRTISSIDLKLEETAKRWQKQIDKLKEFDLNAYNAKMKDINKIIDSFKELMA